MLDSFFFCQENNLKQGDDWNGSVDECNHTQHMYMYNIRNHGAWLLKRKK